MPPLRLWGKKRADLLSWWTLRLTEQLNWHCKVIFNYCLLLLNYPKSSLPANQLDLTIKLFYISKLSLLLINHAALLKSLSLDNFYLARMIATCFWDSNTAGVPLKRFRLVLCFPLSFGFQQPTFSTASKCGISGGFVALAVIESRLFMCPTFYDM